MIRRFFFASLAMLLSACRLSAAALTGQIDPPVVNVGDDVVLTFTMEGGSIAKLVLPTVEGLQEQPGASATTNLTYSAGALQRSETRSFRFRPMHSGDFIIPAFDVMASDGRRLRSKPLQLRVVVAGTDIATTPVPTPSAPPAPPARVNVNPAGPVVLPPDYPGAVPGLVTPPTVDLSNPYASVPRDADGGPAKVFILITTETTDAYIGQAIPIQIDFYIRGEANADQNSLPTVKGSDFLMNNFSIRRGGSMTVVENMQYERDTWRSAISAPKSGDFPLMVQRDTYWVKSVSTASQDPFAGLFNRHQNLAHEMIDSNQLTIHIRPLPDEGRPKHFTGAIGQYRVTGTASPQNIAVGEPVKLMFSVNGVGNFDYVRCPWVPDDPAWKAYVPTSKTSFTNEACTNGVKKFEQSIVAQKSGRLSIQAAVFSYFDPMLKQYITTPIAMPEINVTGTAPATSTPSPDSSENTAAVAATTPPQPDSFLPNRLKMGHAFANLTPLYWQSWFWMIQAVLLIVAFLGGCFYFLRPRLMEDHGKAARARLHSSQQHENRAMREAIQQKDALAFFIAARHAIQLQLGSRWQVSPEALTLGEIRRRDPQLAETLQPLFHQADEIIYSGRAQGPIDLAAWEHKVHEALQTETAPA